MEFVVPAIGFPLLLAFFGLHIKCFFAYRTDAKYLKKTDYDYQPNWVFWALMHLLFYFITAIVYVDYRRSKVDTH